MSEDDFQYGLAKAIVYSGAFLTLVLVVSVIALVLVGITKLIGG